MTQAQLANKLNSHVRTIQDWEYGKNIPGEKHIDELCKVLCITEEDLLYNSIVSTEDHCVNDIANMVSNIQSKCEYALSILKNDSINDVEKTLIEILDLCKFYRYT